jgi:hypothetical protein
MAYATLYYTNSKKGVKINKTQLAKSNIRYYLHLFLEPRYIMSINCKGIAQVAKVGRKLSYDKIRLPSLIDSVTFARGSMGQVADLNEIPRDTFYGWMRAGEDDRNSDVSSDLAQLASKLKNAQALVIHDLVEEGMANEKKSKFIMWWLSKICREDFGADGFELKELRDVFKMILPMMGKGNMPNETNSESKEQDTDE